MSPERLDVIEARRGIYSWSCILQNNVKILHYKGNNLMTMTCFVNCR